MEYHQKDPVVLSNRQIEARANYGRLLKSTWKQIRETFNEGDEFTYGNRRCKFLKLAKEGTRDCTVVYNDLADKPFKSGKRLARTVNPKIFLERAQKCKSSIM